MNRDLLLVVIGAIVIIGGWFLITTLPNDTSTKTIDSTSSLISQNASSESASITEFQESLFTTYVNRFPEWATSMRLFGDEPDPGGDLLNDISMHKQREDLQFVKDGLTQLLAFDRDVLSENEQLTTDVFAWYLDDIARGEAFLFHNYLISHMLFSAPNSLNGFLTGQHRVDSLQDAENYVSRLNQIELKFDQLLAVLRHQEQANLLAPKFILERALGQLSQHDGNPTQSALYTSFSQKLDALPTLNEDQKNQLRADAERAIANKVQPAFNRLRTYLQSVIPFASDDAGVWRLPDGDAYYAYQLRHHTTTDLTPEEVHQLGLSEVVRIQNEMRTLFGELGLNQDAPVFGDAMREFWQLANTTHGTEYENTDEGRERALVDYNSIIHEAEEKVTVLFNRLPNIPMRLERAPFGGNYYVPPSLDGKNPGIFYVNMNPPSPQYRIRTLTYHEAIPGHHFHLGLQVELDLSTLQNALIFTAHAEGWALYAERLARELGLFADPYSSIENLWSELFRAARLVVDTGIHYKRWTRQEALDYYNANLGRPMSHEIDRYIVWPGQAAAYKIGELKILELRERARETLGNRFDIKTFHDLMLGYGQMPLSVLEQHVNAYIKRESQ